MIELKTRTKYDSVAVNSCPNTPAIISPFATSISKSEIAFICEVLSKILVTIKSYQFCPVCQDVSPSHQIFCVSSWIFFHR